MTKVLFLRLAPWMGVSYPHPQDIPYAFDVAQVAALIDSYRYEIFFIDGMVERLSIDNVVKRIISINPKILALTTTSSAKQFASGIFKRVKVFLPDTYIVGFGQHAHYNPRTFLNQSLNIDACVYGEAELTLTELIKESPRTITEKKNIKGIYYWDGQLENTPERPLTIDLDQWPMSRYEIFKNHDYRITSLNFPTFRNIKSGWVLTSRGCPYHCTICSPAIRRSFGNILRKHSPSRVADTFELLANELSVNTIYFGDDTFSLDMEWVDEVCSQLIKRNNSVQWGMSTRADKLSSKLIKKMRDAGLRAVSIGVESGSKRILEDINKGISHEQIEWVMSEFEKNKISVNVTAIIGHVNETVDELKQTFSFLKKTKSFFVQLHYLSPYPGTKIAEVFKEKFGDIEDISHFNVMPKNVSKIPDKILRGVIQKFYLGYYRSWDFIKKYFKYRLPYAICNPIKELQLIKDSLAYFLLSAKNKTDIKKGKITKIKKVFVPRQSISIGWKEIFKAFFQFLFKSGCKENVIRWEKKFSELIKVPFAISFISERAGTYFTLKVLKEMNHWEKPEIICPSYTFFSVPWAAKLAGWEVRFADVLDKDLTLDPESLEWQINEKTKAVIVTHLNGKPAKMVDIAHISRGKNLRILEDCAHATGLEIDGKAIGSWDIGCFSFGDGKNLGTFGGGIITTSDPELAVALKNLTSGFPEQSKMQIAKKIFDTFLLKTLTTNIFYPLFLYPLLRWFGYLNSDRRRNDFLNFSKKTTEKELAFNFSDVQAQVGLRQLGGLVQRNEIRRENSRIFRMKLSEKTLEKILPWNGKDAHTMLHDAIVLDCGNGIIKESLKMGIDLRLDYCGNCRNFPGMEDSPGDDEVGKRMDGKIFFIPNHLGISPNVAGKIPLVLDSLFLKSDNGKNNNFLIRRAVESDANNAANILNKSFDSKDEQRILGEGITITLFKMLFQSEDTLFLIAEEQKIFLGYIWLQLKELSLLKCFKNASFKTIVVIVSVLKEFKLRLLISLLKNQNKQSPLTICYPKIISLAVDETVRRKGIGTMLITESQKYLANRGIGDISVLTSAANLVAISFYEKNGFERIKNNRACVVFHKKIICNDKNINEV